jgi:DNA-directed RNA polymerase specialized sigma24 family protein
MEPGLRALVAQHYWLTEEADLRAATVAIAWERIRTYPFHNRPRRIAANVLRDTSHRLRRAYPREAQLVLAAIDDAPVEGADLRLDTVVLMDLVSRSLDPTSSAVVVRTRIRGESVATVAGELHCSPNALRERRRRAERRLKVALVRSGDVPAGRAS